MPEDEHLSNVDGTSPPDVYHVERDEEYLRQLRAEEEYWDSHPSLLANAPQRFPVLDAYLNERLTGDAGRRWYETMGDYGEFTSGCVLGAGPGKIESYLLARHPGLRLTVYDVSAEALARLQQRVEAEFPGRVETQHQDLNFVTLEPDTYDLAFTNSCIHHLLNLEHVAYQVNGALTAGGHFFLEEPVGESFFQFSEQKKRLFQAFVSATQDNPGDAEPIPWPDRDDWQYSPFETVRSAEILDVFGRYLEPVRVNTVGALIQLTLFGHTGYFARPRALHERIVRKVLRLAYRLRLYSPRSLIARAKARAELLCLLDAFYTDSGLLTPGNAFAVYRKRPS